MCICGVSSDGESSSQAARAANWFRQKTKTLTMLIQLENEFTHSQMTNPSRSEMVMCPGLIYSQFGYNDVILDGLAVKIIEWGIRNNVVLDSLSARKVAFWVFCCGDVTLLRSLSAHKYVSLRYSAGFEDHQRESMPYCAMFNHQLDMIYANAIRRCVYLLYLSSVGSMSNEMMW